MTPLLRCDGIHVTFAASSRRGEVAAVTDVSFVLERGAALGIAGESGAGKSTLARVLCALQEPTRGRVLLDGEAFGARAPRAMRRRVQIVFQDPGASLDPRFTVQDSVGEGLAIHGLAPRDGRRDRCAELLGRVGLDAGLLDRFPNELSGGQKQRVAIARALAVEPDVIVFDEPTASLDSGASAAILELLTGLRDSGDSSVVLVSHDLDVIRAVASEIMVMYAGSVMERASTADLYSGPIHPYTRALLGAAAGDRAWIEAGAAAAAGGREAGGCPYQGPCDDAEAECALRRPPLVELEGGRAVACPVNEKTRERQ